MNRQLIINDWVNIRVEKIRYDLVNHLMTHNNTNMITHVSLNEITTNHYMDIIDKLQSLGYSIKHYRYNKRSSHTNNACDELYIEFE